MIGFFLRGLIIGFSIAAPVGPIGVLCIRRTLAEGRAFGFASGLGAATADAVYGAIAAFGLTFLLGFLLREQAVFRLAGGLFLVTLGVRTNPMTILSFAAIFAGLGIAAARTYTAAGALVAGFGLLALVSLR